MNLDNIIAINTETFYPKFKNITEEDYLEQVVTTVSDRTLEILMRQSTSLEEIQNICKLIVEWKMN